MLGKLATIISFRFSFETRDKLVHGTKSEPSIYPAFYAISEPSLASDCRTKRKPFGDSVTGVSRQRK